MSFCKVKLYKDEPKSEGVFCNLEEGHEGLHKATMKSNAFHATISWPQDEEELTYEPEGEYDIGGEG